MKNVWLHNVLLLEVEVVHNSLTASAGGQSNKLTAYCVCVKYSDELIVYGSPE